MKIIKKGKLQTIRFTCEKCGCVFEADESEYDNISLPISPYCVRAEVRCPYCRSLTIKWIKE